MAMPAIGQPLMEVGQSSLTAIQSLQTPTNPILILNYVKLLKPQALNSPMQVTNANLKLVEYLHGEPMMRGKKTEVKQLIVQQGLHLAVLGKFSYGKPMIQELRKVIPIQCELKGPFAIGLIVDTYVLIKLLLMEDYIHLL